MDIEVIKNSQTIAEAIIKIYGYDNGNTRKKFFELIVSNDYDIKHLRKRVLKYPIVFKDCPVCGKRFETKKGSRDEKTTCSYPCSNTHFRSGQNNPNWGSGGESRERNGYRRIGFDHHNKECIICGENKIVAIHHFDGNHSNNSPENLIPLCPTHHQYIHSQHKNDVIDKVVEYRKKYLERMLCMRK